MLSNAWAMFADTQQHAGPPPPHAQRMPRNPRYVWSNKIHTQQTKAQMLDLQAVMQQWTMMTQVQSTVVKELGDTLKGVIQKAA